MWIRQVIAHAFGPFKGDTLHLAEGMTVVVGDNEAGKSSWHAAIYAGLCGMRRGKGRRPKEDEEFAARHAPWDGGPWEVEAVVRLAEGRTVELRHDLGAQVSSSVRDVDLGHDLASEIIHDGAPDGSRWLGLDRRAFAAVACVRQAEILAVTQHADSLQRHLQRAAATAGTDETAATALSALDTFLREHVGSERANATKPLMEAIRAHQAAEDRLGQAVTAHSEWQQREEALGRVEAEAGAASQRLHSARARRASQLADVVARRTAAARSLAAAHPEPPPSVSADDELAASVATALHGWINRPVVTPTDARSAAEIRQMLDAVPPRPEGDLEPEADVTRLRRTLADAVTRLEAHRLGAPVAVGHVDSGGATESELVDLARELAAPDPVVDPALVAEAERLRQQPSPGTGGEARRPAVIAASVAVLAVIAGVGLVVAGQAPVGVGALVLGALSGAVALVLLLTASPPGPHDRTELQAIEARLAIAEQRLDEARERRARAEHRTRELGLEPDPAALRRLADQIRHSEQAAAARQQWDTAHAGLAAEVAQVGQQLVAVLAARGVDVPSDNDPAGLLAAVDDYEQACRQRRDVAVQAQQRDILLAELHAAERAESRRRDDERRIEAARSALIEVATDLGLADGDAVVTEPDLLVARLQGWGADRDHRRAATEQALDEWHQLQVLLDGRSLDDLEAEAARLRRSADELGAALPCDAVDQVDLGTDPDSTIRQLQQHAEQLNVSLAEARRELAVRAESLVPVAEATEALGLATAELDRVRRLERTLTTTQQFMLEAQERVHRDIAPVLAAKVEGRLSRVTDGRYSQVTIDPESLGVRVRDSDGRWRDASYLSHGTAEQVFLLLRVAMSEILAKGRCPLLLDDVTVQSDARRTRAILDVLHEVSAEHQVILFSQEDDVVNWATGHLGDRDRLVRLS
jgi:DNA repair protein SbcC/Rad50